MLGGKFRAINICNMDKKGYKINHQDECNWQSPANWGKKTNTGHKLKIRDRRWDITTYPIVIKG